LTSLPQTVQNLLLHCWKISIVQQKHSNFTR